MRHSLVWLIIVVTGTAAQAQLPPPPDQINLNIPGMTPPPQQSAPSLPQYNAPQPQVIRPVSGNTESIKSGSVVRVRRQTVVRSRPTDHAYVCNTLPAGSTVTLLEIPKPGSEYATIATPDNCYSLVPSSSLYMLFPPKNFKDAPQPIKSLTEPLIDGEPGVGAEYVGSGTKLQKGTQVDVVNEKKIMVHGKVKNYVVIRSSGKDVRFVRTADLEGVEDAARQTQVTFPASPLNQYQQPGYQQQQPPPQFNNNSNNSMLLQQGQASVPVPEGEQLPPALAGQVQSADQAYQMALRSGAWEDARMRYQYLMEADVMSVRILAKNRLEFIREWQTNPPAQPVAQQQAGYLSPAYNAFAWVPGDGSAFRTQSTAMNTTFGNSVNNPNPTFGSVVAAPPRETVVRPAPPVTNPAAASQVKIPTYQDQQLQQPAASPLQQYQPQSTPIAQQQQQQQRIPQQPIASPAATAAAPTGKWIGKLNKAVQYNAGSQLYYLTNSQGLLVHYLRGNSVTGPQLASQVGKIVEVEGSIIKVPMDGQMKEQINAVTVRPKN